MSKLDRIITDIQVNEHFGLPTDSKQEIKDLMFELVGEDYKPNTLDNDERWVRSIPPSSERYVPKDEAISANYEFRELRKAIGEL